MEIPTALWIDILDNFLVGSLVQACQPCNIQLKKKNSYLSVPLKKTKRETGVRRFDRWNITDYDTWRTQLNSSWESSNEFWTVKWLWTAKWGPTAKKCWVQRSSCHSSRRLFYYYSLFIVSFGLCNVSYPFPSQNSPVLNWYVFNNWRKRTDVVEWDLNIKNSVFIHVDISDGVLQENICFAV